MKSDRTFWNPEADCAFIAISVALTKQALSRFTIQICAFRLVVRTFVPLKAHPEHGFQNAPRHVFAGARDVCVLDAKDERPVEFTRKEPVEQRGSRATDM